MTARPGAEGLRERADASYASNHGRLGRGREVWAVDTLILIPAFNEQRDIARVVRSVSAAVPGLPVAIIDDGSHDGTADAARSAGAIVLSHPFNLHYGAALSTGYAYALEQGYERIVQMDADGQHDAASIRVVLDALDRGADLVLGSRFRDPDSYTPPRIRRIGIGLMSLVTRWVLGLAITDAATGFQGLSRRLVRFYVTGAHFPHDYPDANVIIRAARAGFRIVEVPARMHAAERGGGMHAGVKALWYAFKMAVAITVELSRRIPAGVDE